jgi:hypothetical protein
MKNKGKSMSRRKFIGGSALAAASVSIVPRHVLGGVGYKAPSDTLNIAGVGVGGMGKGNLSKMDSENIVALCDVDWKYAKGTFDKYPKAKKFWDWREMYDKMGDQIDAVMIATADHSHAIVAAHGMTLGKHIYLQKPLTHSVYESRLMTKLAAKYKVATQMGNQGASGDGVAQICEAIWSGAIGEVTKVESFTDRPIWPQGLNTPERGDWVPETLNWDLFTGPAKMVPFNHVYHPWNWRGWWNYGTGALGDMACHILHPVFESLKLGYPTQAQGSSTLLLESCAPSAQAVKLTFPERAKVGKVKMPEVDISWFDGGIKPMLPENWPAGKNPNKSGGGTFFYGTKDILHAGCYGVRPELLSGKKMDFAKTERRVPGGSGGHEADWIRACKETAANRVPATSDFAEAGPFNEMVVMGVLAVRLQALNQTLDWDGENMKFTNIPESAKIKTVIKDGFTIEDGHPSFDKTMTEPESASAMAKELIKHTYRDGWKLPDMPA